MVPEDKSFVGEKAPVCGNKSFTGEKAPVSEVKTSISEASVSGTTESSSTIVSELTPSTATEPCLTPNDGSMNVNASSSTSSSPDKPVFVVVSQSSTKRLSPRGGNPVPESQQVQYVLIRSGRRLPVYSAAEIGRAHV